LNVYLKALRGQFAYATFEWDIEIREYIFLGDFLYFRFLGFFKAKG